MATTAAGRPSIGPTVQLRIPDDLLDRVNNAATQRGVRRAAWLRAAAEHELDYSHTTLAAMVAWMFQTGGFANTDIVYALEKPWKHREYLHASRHNLSLAELDQQLEAKRDAEASMDQHPTGSTLVETSPVDFQVFCPHVRLIVDSVNRGPSTCPLCPPGEHLGVGAARRSL